MQDCLPLETHPLALSENMITGDKYRITFHEGTGVRLEYDEEGVLRIAPADGVFKGFSKTDYRVRTGIRIEVHAVHLIYNEKEFTNWD